MSEGTHVPSDLGSLPFLAQSGETGRLIAAYDWSKTALGPIVGWPASVKTTVALVLRSPVPIVTLWHEDGVMIYNDAYSVFAGGRHPAILGAKVREAWPEVASFNDNVMKVGLAGGTLSYLDQVLTLYRHGVAESVWLNLDYSPLLDEAGRPIGVIAIVVETTAKVRAERRIAGERERLRQMFEQAPGIIAMVAGPEHVFAMANAACRRFLGERALLGHRLRDALPEVAEQGYAELLDRVYASGQPYVGEAKRLLLRSSPGAPALEQFLDFVCQPLLAEDGSVSGIFVQAHVVTEQQRAEMALRESEERFRLVAESAPVMLWMGDSSGKCIYLNDAQRRFWGVPVEKVEGFDWSQTLHPEDGDKLYLPYQAAMRDFEPFAVEARFRRSDGAWRVLHTTARPRFDPAGDFVGMIGVNVDVTEIRQVEATLERRVAEAVAERSKAEEALRQAQKMEAIGKLTGGVAHDFNNLLQVVSGNLQLLSKEVAGNERAQQRIDAALAGVDRGARLANQLLAFSRRQALEPKVMNIGRIISGVADMLRRTIGEAIEIETVVSGGLWNSFIDPSQLENALLNLAINARDAMEQQQGGKLTIEAGNAYLDDSYVLGHSDVAPGQYVVLAVTDTGSGMTPEILAQVFEPFFSTKPQGKGTGLGLSMVYGFVKQSGGHVKLYSEPGHGTTVKLYFPRSLRSEDAVVASAAGPIAGGTETILVAEDDDEVRATVAEMLRDLGYGVLTARDGAGALTVIESGVPIDLLYTDVVMPGPLRGVELARQARERLPSIAVLFTSGYTENAIVHGGRLDPGVELLSKPYTREALARKVRHVLGNAAQRVGRPPSQPQEPAPPFDGLVALLCEDDVLIRMSTAAMLAELGATVVEAGHAAEALALLAGRRIDVLVADVGLPDLSGEELATRARALLPELPIVFATGHAKLGFAAGLARTSVLSKPYSEVDLQASIARLLGQRPGA